MPALTELDLRPSLLLAMWAGGMALGIAAVAWRRVVGPAYLWVAGGSALLVAGFAAAGGGWALAGAPAVAFGIVTARRPALAASGFALGGLALVVHAFPFGGPLVAITGAVALGGVTCEMLLGHWYLVDPSLPRSALRWLCGAGIVGLVADGAALAAGGVAGSEVTVLVVTWVVLLGFSTLLMVGVWFSLREEGYEGVMAATGLSYLAVLTSLGGIALGRVLLLSV